MRKRLIPWLRAGSVAIMAVAVVALVRWHPAWAIWVAVAFFSANVIMVITLAVGWTYLKRREQAIESTDEPDEEHNDDAA
jgi:membrane protein implicated in regulation of membrane protease activity